MEADIRQELFCHLQKQSFTFFDQTRTGQIMSRLINDLFEIVELAHHGPEDIFISAIMLIGSFTALFVIQWKLALILLCMVPITVVFIVKKRTNMGQASRKLKEKTGNINSALESSISGIRVAKAFANEDYELEKFLEDNNEYRNSKNGFYKAMGTFHAGVETLACFFGFFVLFVGGLLIMNKGVVMTRENIMIHVWGTDFEGESRTVDMHIKTLRQKLGNAGSRIRTVRNVGYVIE